MSSPHPHRICGAALRRRSEHRPSRGALALVGAVSTAVLLGSCAAPHAAAGPDQDAADFTGCVLGSSGGFRDRSFNQDIHESTRVLEDSLGIEVRTEESGTPREAEQKLVPGSELRVVDSVAGHLGLFGFEPDYMPQIDRHLGELLETPA